MLDQPDPVNESKVFATVDAICASKSFDSAGQMQRLLRHIVRHTLAGRHDVLLGKNIAVDVFGADLSTASDAAAVRVEIGRLRRRLKRYYAAEGARNEIVISIPKGAYVAEFEHRIVPGSEKNAPANMSMWQNSAIAAVWRHHNPLWLVLGAIAVGIAALALTFWSGRAESISTKPRIAVAPIHVLIDDPDMQRFAAGLSADLVNRLARFDHMVVVSRRAVSGISRRSQDVDPADPGLIARLAEADYQLNGLVQRGADGTRLSVELIRAAGSDVVWVNEYVLPETDQELFSAQIDIANSVAKSLASKSGQIPLLELSASESAALRPGYVCVLRTYAYLEGRSPGEHGAVRDCLETAVRTTPLYGEAWSALANVYLDEHRNGFNPRGGRPSALNRAHEAARKGIELSPNSASAHSVLAAVEYFRGDLPAFRAAARAGIEANPNDVDALSYYGHLLTVSGEMQEGQRLVDRAKAMSPVHPPLWHHATTMVALVEGDYDRAVAEAIKSEMPPFYLSYVLLAAAHAHAGQPDLAQRAFERLEEMRPGYVSQIAGDLGTRNFEPAIISALSEGLRIASELHAPDPQD